MFSIFALYVIYALIESQISHKRKDDAFKIVCITWHAIIIFLVLISSLKKEYSTNTLWNLLRVCTSITLLLAQIKYNSTLPMLGSFALAFFG